MAEKPDEWMPLYVRKYLGDTTHLNRDQHGAYLMLLMAYWMRGGGLPNNDDQLATIVKASRAEWRKLRPILEPFFQVEGDKWIQSRAEKELTRARATMKAKSEAGRKGAKNRWQTNGDANGRRMAEAPVSQCQTDAPIPKPVPISEAKASSIELPDWLPREPWLAFLESRRRQKIPNTQRSLTLVLNKLEEFRGKGHDPGELLDRAVERGWRSVFEPNERTGNGQADRKSTAHDRFLAGALSVISGGADAGTEPGLAGGGDDDAGAAGYPLLPARLHGGTG